MGAPKIHNPKFGEVLRSCSLVMPPTPRASPSKSRAFFCGGFRCWWAAHGPGHAPHSQRKPTPNHGQFFVAVSVPSGWRMVWFMPTPPGASPPLVKGNLFWRFPFLVGGAWSWSCPSQCKPRVYKLGAYTLGAYRLEPPMRGLEMHSLRWGLQVGGLQPNGLSRNLYGMRKFRDRPIDHKIAAEWPVKESVRNARIL